MYPCHGLCLVARYPGRVTISRRTAALDGRHDVLNTSSAGVDPKKGRSLHVSCACPSSTPPRHATLSITRSCGPSYPALACYKELSQPPSHYGIRRHVSTPLPPITGIRRHVSPPLPPTTGMRWHVSTPAWQNACEHVCAELDDGEGSLYVMLLSLRREFSFAPLLVSLAFCWCCSWARSVAFHVQTPSRALCNSNKGRRTREPQKAMGRNQLNARRLCGTCCEWASWV